MKGFQEYPKKYEDLKRVGADSAYHDRWSSSRWPRDEYLARCKKTARHINDVLFRVFVEHTWLGLQYRYTRIVHLREAASTNFSFNSPLRSSFKMPTKVSRHSPFYSSTLVPSRPPSPPRMWLPAYGYFVRHLVGLPNFGLTRNVWSFRVGTYLKDLFPEYLAHDPWEEPEYFKFPFKNIGIDHMFFVYQMPERFNLLQIAENHNMSYDAFYNYVVNYIYCVNEQQAPSDTKPKFHLVGVVPSWGLGTSPYVVWCDYKPLHFEDGFLEYHPTTGYAHDKKD